MSYYASCVVTEQNKIEIVKLGALQPLIRLTKARDIRVKRNSAGALLNLSHVGMYLCNHFDHVILWTHPPAANRISIVGEGGVPYLVQLLESQDEEIQFYCSATLSNIAVDGRRGYQKSHHLFQPLFIYRRTPECNNECW